MAKIRFMATGDIHSDEKFIEYLKKYAPFDKVDFVFLNGDISEKNDDFAKIFEIFKGKKIFMVPGNHESKKKLEILEEHYGVDLIGNRPILLHDDLTVFGTNYLNIGPYGVTEEEVFANLVQNFDAIKDVKHKVMLAHMPPVETKIGDSSPFFPFISGSVAQRAFLDHFNPDFTLVGHIHETSGLEEIVNKTKVINIGKTFKIFEFDTEKSELNMIDDFTHIK